MRRTTSARSLLAGACLAAALSVAACDADPAAEPDRSRAGSSGTADASGAGTPLSGSPAPAPGPRTAPTPSETERVRLRGIDASHHQGAVDWRAVAGDGVAFAYLKATEGTGFVDPMFQANRRAALDVGIEVGGYHYFQLCTPGVAQAEHFLSVLGEVGPHQLPPALDLELFGSCSTPPPRAQLLAEVRAFLALVEERTGRRPIVYLYPSFEERFGFAAELAGHRQWVRSLGSRPARDFWIWQRSATGTVAGIAGPVDINVRWARRTVGR